MAPWRTRMAADTKGNGLMGSSMGLERMSPTSARREKVFGSMACASCGPTACRRPWKPKTFKFHVGSLSSCHVFVHPATCANMLILFWTFAQHCSPRVFGFTVQGIFAQHCSPRVFGFTVQSIFQN